MSQSFEKEFKTLRELGESSFVLRGSSIIVEIQEPEEIKTAGGIIVAAPTAHAKGQSVAAHRIEVGKVLMTGPGYWNDQIPVEVKGYDETPDGHRVNTSDTMYTAGYEPLEVKPGAIVLMPQHSYSLISHFPGIHRPTSNKLALVKMDAITAYYPSQEAYETVKSKLNS